MRPYRPGGGKVPRSLLVLSGALLLLMLYPTQATACEACNEIQLGTQTLQTGFCATVTYGDPPGTDHCYTFMSPWPQCNSNGNRCEYYGPADNRPDRDPLYGPGLDCWWTDLYGGCLMRSPLY